MGPFEFVATRSSIAPIGICQDVMEGLFQNQNIAESPPDPRLTALTARESWRRATT